WHRRGRDTWLSLRRDEMPTKEPSRRGQVIRRGEPVVCECGETAPGIAPGRAVSPTQGLRCYSSRRAMRTVRPGAATAWWTRTRTSAPPSRLAPTTQPYTHGTTRPLAAPALP